MTHWKKTAFITFFQGKGKVNLFFFVHIMNNEINHNEDFNSNMSYLPVKQTGPVSLLTEQVLLCCKKYKKTGFELGLYKSRPGQKRLFESNKVRHFISFL